MDSNSYTLDFFRQFFVVSSIKKLGNLHSSSVNLNNFAYFWETLAKCLISPNWKKNFFPTSYHQDCTSITFIQTDKFSTKILTRIALKLGTQIRNITSIPSGEGEQLPMILCLKHGLP
jgi:hypothetical protein